jgi:CRISPR system Cascade subunit CasE
MYLSRLVLNLRHRWARRDVANPHEMHSTLLRLFDDPKAARPLWRLESMNPPTVLLQSTQPPDFGRLLTTNGYDGYFACPPQSKPYHLPDGLVEGQVLRFRLEANPTVTRRGKRHGLRRVDEQLVWLHRQAQRHGFDVLAATVSRIERRSFRKRTGGAPIVLLAVRFDGYLQVREPYLLKRAIAQGIGHGKALGCGLLSIAPAR